MRKLPTLLAAVFIGITLFRVAAFADVRMHAGVLGWLFSIGLGAGVYLASYYTRDNITRQDGKEDKRDTNVKTWSWIVLVFFAIVDAVFNFVEVWLSVNPTTKEMQITTGMYGVFPTVASALLGAMQGHIDRLPVAPTKATTNVIGAIRRALTATIDRWAQPNVSTPAQVVAPALPDKQPEPQQVAKQSEPVAIQAQPDETPTKLERILTVHHENPKYSSAKIAQQVGTSPQYVRRILATKDGKAQ